MAACFAMTAGFSIGSAAAGDMILVTGNESPASGSLIQQAIDALPEDRVRIATIRPSGDFLIEETITLPSRTRLDLSDAALILAPGARTTLVTNKDHEEGNALIQITGGILDGRKAEQGGGEFHGIALFRVDDALVSEVTVENCSGDGVLINGRGRHTRNVRLSSIYSRENGRHGVNIMWAVRQITVDSIIANNNNAVGLRSDHSEGLYSNIMADGNGGHGIFIRNVFGNVYTNLNATRNGQSGIHVQGMLHSSASNWSAHNNSRGKPDEWSDVQFIADDTLSYGRTGFSTVTGINAGGFHQYGVLSERYALELELGAESFEELHLSGLVLTPGISGTTPDE